MSAYAFARRGARVGLCVLALGVTAASAQQPATENPSANSADTSLPAAQELDTVKPAEPAAPQATAPSSEAPTSNLPELVVDGQEKKKKKTSAAKDKTNVAPTSGTAADAAPPPPGVTLGTSPSDTGTTTFDASNVNMRTDGSGDANTFMRNLPNVQYQNNSAFGSSSGGGATSQGTIDTKPELLSISGGRTYENNFVLNGVSMTNITGPVEARRNARPDVLTTSAPDAGAVYGMSPQNMYVPSDFIGTATVIDSNASAEYGQFLGGAVLYDLSAPPTDRYHASVSASRDTSEWASYILATPDGTNPGNVAPPKYMKTNLSASVGAPITSDFAFIAQASRRQAESERQLAPQLGRFTVPEDSDNIFLRFAATARTDIGKFTLDTSRTDYSQHWVWWFGDNIYRDTNTESSATQLKYETDLTGVRSDAIGLGKVKLTSRAFYNTNETQNTSGSNGIWTKLNQRYSPTGVLLYDTSLDSEGWCYDIAGTNPMFNDGTLPCNTGGFGTILQGQKDFGVQAGLKGNLLLGSFNTGLEIKQYEGHRARPQDYTSGGASYVIYNGMIMQENGNATAFTPPVGGFNCTGIELCTPEQFARQRTLARAFDVSTTLNALHTFAEVDQTWKWFNVRAGVRLDYDDYFDNMNWAPRLAGSVTPIDGLRFTIGYNRYYLGETLYYALRDKQPINATVSRGYNSTTGVIGPWGTNTNIYEYRTGSPETPYDDEYTAAANVRDPVLGGMFRFKYLERYGKDQFSTVSCGTYCMAVGNEGETSYRSASAEYTKEWNGLNNAISLNAAALTGNVTWSKQGNSRNNYLLSTDVGSDGATDVLRYYYDGRSYAPEEFNVITGNLDIPVRFGATLSTLWFNGALELNATAGIDLAFQGVGDTGRLKTDPTVAGCEGQCYWWEDRQFKTTLKLDVSGQINVTEQAAIVFSASNLTNSDQNVIATNSNNPWVLGRSYYLGSALRF